MSDSEPAISVSDGARHQHIMLTCCRSAEKKYYKIKESNIFCHPVDKQPTIEATHLPPLFIPKALPLSSPPPHSAPPPLPLAKH